MTDEWMAALRAGMLAVVAAVMAHVDFRWDRTEGRIPNAVSLPILALGAVGAAVFRDPTGLILWPAFYLGWKAGGVGGGDAKVWMGISALAGIEACAIGLVILVMLARVRLWHRGYGWIFGLRPRARVPMSLPTAGMAAGASVLHLLVGLNVL